MSTGSYKILPSGCRAGISKVVHLMDLITVITISVGNRAFILDRTGGDNIFKV